MFGRLFFVTSVLVLSVLTSMAQADIKSGLVGHWKLDDGSGTTARDSSGNGNHGTLINSPEWQTAGGEVRVGSSAIEFDFPADGSTTSSDYVDCGNKSEFNITDNITLAVWVKCDGFRQRFQYFFSKDIGGGGYSIIRNAETRNLRVVFNGLSGQYFATGSKVIDDGQWHHMAASYDTTTGIVAFYTDGALEVSETASGTIPTNDLSLTIGGRDVRNCNAFIDDARIYHRTLNADDIMELYLHTSDETATIVAPGNGTTDVPRDVIVRWQPGDFAVTHNVYLGTSFEDVNDGNAAVLVSERQVATTYVPGRLDFGTTYYWRIDEVNSAPDFTVHQGDVWSFTTEPFAIPVANITAMASTAFGASLPEKTIDGSGLVDDLHGTSTGDMWISTGVPATIEYAFDNVYKLHELWVWNSNQLIEAFVGFGAKDVVVEHSLDGENWTVLDGVGPLAQAPGAEEYAHNNTIDMGGTSAQHVRLTINSVQGFAPQASLSEVRFFSIPTLATRPSPESGAGDVSAAVTLAWGRNGREADRHDVYFGTDPDNLPLAGTVSESSLDTGALGLLLGETYHWRVDEVNEAMDPSTWEGSLWSFSTADRIVVDDMESYEDKEFLEIWAIWVDGFEDPANGSLVGNGAAGVPETSITHGGGQSLPLHYDNSGAGLSEATRTFAPAQDWTIGSAETLVVHFQGALANSGGGQVYVKINNVKVTYDANPAAISSPFWTQWNIDLTGVGMVNSLTIGVEGAGAQGVLYVDDMTLYRQAPEPVGAQDPGTDNLVAYYALDNNAQDGSGNGHNGTLEGSPVYVSPGWDGAGACLQFGGQDARITVESFDVTGSGITLAAWVNPSLFTNDARMISKSEGGGTNFHYWAMVLSGGGENNLQFRLRTDVGNTTSRTSAGNPLVTDEWTHLALAWDAADPVMRQYKNGQEIDSVDKAGTAVATGPGVKIGIGNQSISADSDGATNLIRPFDGLIDEVRVYSRGLSPAEMLSVAFGQ